MTIIFGIRYGLGYPLMEWSHPIYGQSIVSIFVKGVQRISRPVIINNALKVLCFFRAKIAYSEHVGINLHLGRMTGDILRL